MTNLPSGTISFSHYLEVMTEASKSLTEELLNNSKEIFVPVFTTSEIKMPKHKPYLVHEYGKKRDFRVSMEKTKGGYMVIFARTEKQV